jgi:hypothetical protein
MSEFLVGVVQETAKSWGMTEVFVGVILVAIIGNAAKHSTAILMALTVPFADTSLDLLRSTASGLDPEAVARRRGDLDGRSQGRRDRPVPRSRLGTSEEEGRRTWAERDRSNFTFGQELPITTVSCGAAQSLGAPPA